MNFNSTRTIDIQGHRGCRGLLPENSLPGFEKAIALGVHTLELDVVISKDKQVVISHEPYLNHEIALDLNGAPISRAEETSFNLYNMTYDTIKQYDCGTKAHPRFPDQERLKVYKPLLEELFKLVATKYPQIKYNIEIKSLPEYYEIFSPAPEEFVRLVLKVLRDAGVKEKTRLQSFDINILETLKKQDPKIEVSLLVHEYESIQQKLRRLSYRPDVISPYFKLLNSDIVSNYQEQGYKIIPWTVNTVNNLKNMIRYQVDGIITDYPNRLVALLKND